MLTRAEPAPPGKGRNAWTLRLLDGAGRPVSGARLEVLPWMPDHKHGATVAPVITDNGDGTYLIERLALTMEGVWETTITATVGEIEDEAVFTFCIGT